MQRGRQERVVIAGCDEVTPRLLDFYTALGGLVRDRRARAFDGADGFNPGEGAGALMLEGLDAARSRGAEVLAVISASAETQDPKLAGGLSDGNGLARAVRQCIKRAGIAAGDIGAVIATGSWTASAQKAERAAIAAVLGTDAAPPCSVIEQTGFLPAAGPLLNIGAAITKLRTDDCLRHVLVMGGDVTGPHSAFIVSRPQAVH